MMQVLSGHSLTVADRFQPETMSLQLTERTSTATMTLDDTAPALAVGDWLRSDNGPAGGTVWRVRSIDTQYDRNTRTVTLEHIISTLKDRIMFGEVKPEDISGGTTATAEQAVAYILARQDDWVIGTMARTATKPYTFNGDTLFSALEMVSNTLTECVWEYDFSSYPFTLNMWAIDNDFASEMRMDRNIRTLKKSIDRSRMYTRFYPIGKNDLHLTGEYVSENESLYGVICKTETDQSKETEGELYDWAMERLNRHSHPMVTITISGEDLSEATGEPLDSFTMGKYCRIPLPEFGTYIMERVSKLSYPDVIHDPETVTVTLANEVPDVASIYRQEVVEKGGRGGRAGAKNAGEDHAWFIDTEDHVGMVAEAVAGEGAAEDWSRVAAVIVDGNGVHQRVTEAQGEIVLMQSQLNITEQAITAEVMRANSVEGELRSDIIQTASMIMSSVSANNSQIYSEVVQTASLIRSEVHNSLSDFYTMIMQTASEIIIRTGDNTKTFRQDTAPVGTADHPLVDGDLWFNSTGKFIWNDLANDHWLDDTATDWRTLKAAEISRYNGTTNQWEKVVDEKAILQDTRYQQNKEHIQLVAGRVDATDGKVESYRAEFEVKADQITSSVTEQVNGLNSRITQTATQIRSEVGSSKSEIYSEILQTATMIYSHVANEKAGLHSEIVQTSSMIRTEVRNTVSGLKSSITQTANKVAIVVDDENNVRTSSIVAGINAQSGSYVKISASKINLSGYVTASELNATQATIDNLKSGVTTASVLRATSFYGSNGSFTNLSASNAFSCMGYGVSYKQIVASNGTFYVLAR